MLDNLLIWVNTWSNQACLKKGLIIDGDELILKMQSWVRSVQLEEIDLDDYEEEDIKNLIVDNYPGGLQGFIKNYKSRSSCQSQY